MARAESYTIVIYPSENGNGWVAMMPAIAGCHAVMATRDEAVAELKNNVFQMISEEYEERGEALPEDRTEIDSFAVDA